jgi:geranylgeranyl diphosphate synthase type II
VAAANPRFGLATFMREQSARVESLLKERLDELARDAPPPLKEAMQYSLLGGGKRVRPILCLAFSEAISKATGGAGRVAEDAACAVEMVHSYSLVHDDLPAMDNDDFRRGKPTTHKAFGDAIAILVGDALLTGAFAVLSDGPEPERAPLCRELAQAAGACGMVGGQVLDIAKDRGKEESYLVRMHRLKTGALIRGACRMGVISAKGTSKELQIADAYGDAVGLAFQIADDILDVTGDSAQIGKPTGADAAASRSTFPAVLGLAQSRSLANERVEHAVDAIGALEPPGGPLQALARYALERER